MILMKYHTLLLFLKKRQNLRLLSAEILGGALRVRNDVVKFVICCSRDQYFKG